MENSHNSKATDSDIPAPFQRKKIVFHLRDKICLLVGSITLLPIRIFILILCLLLAWCFASLGILGMDESKPASGFRRILQKVDYFIARFIVRFCFGFLSPKITGDFLPPEDAPILLVAPHTSIFDFWVVCWLGSGEHCSALVREENRHTPFLGTIFRFMQMVFVRRSSRTSRQEAVDNISMRTENKDWGRLVIFPEGTTSNGSSLLPFKRGAFLPGAHQVHPVVLRYPNRLDCTTWTQGNGGIRGAAVVVMRAMATLYNRAEVEVMPPVKPEGDPVKFGAIVRRSMGKKMGLALYEGNLTFVERNFE